MPPALGANGMTGVRPASALFPQGVGWSDDDYASHPRRVITVADPWMPSPSSPNGRSSRQQETSGSEVAWIWHLPKKTPSPKEPPEPKFRDWWFHEAKRNNKPVLRQSPFGLNLDVPGPSNLHQKRARWLVNLLDVAEPRRRISFIRFFEDLFSEMNHHSTYAALADLALDEPVAGDHLVEACRFRIVFMQRSQWWALRNSFGVYVPGSGSSLLGWKRSLRLVRLVGGDPSPLIEDDWYGDWLQLPRNDPHSHRYVDYVEARLTLMSDGIWDGDILVERKVNRTSDWRRTYGLPGASPYARTATLINLKSVKEEFKPC
jgi:hypothetical protein